MIFTKRGQSLPINTIVIAILALLVLVFVILFATGSFSSLFGQTKNIGESSDTSIVAAQTKCAQWCLTAQGSKTTSEWTSSKFCKDTQLIDTDGDGASETYLCNSDVISATCSTQIGGEQITQDRCNA
jgi:hypothetical protein